jgi:predicted  nucleic acid-binding Zn-ribbon protein
MLPDLDRLIHLQALDSELLALRRTIDTENDRRTAIQAQLEQQRTAVAAARDRAAENQSARRALEKDVAQVQSRLDRYKDQLMAVKTNKEYHAMQTEIAAAEAEVRRFEDRILEVMLEGDEIGAASKAAERALADAERDTARAIEGLATETTQARARLESAAAARAELTQALPRDIVELYDHIARNRGTAVVPAREGHCSVCHVRLRPKVYQDVRRNDTIIQCDSCQRILYFVPPQPPQPQPAPEPPPQA